MVERDEFTIGFRRARQEAAVRLARPDFDEREAAAKEIGISTSMLKQIETGKRRPSFEVLLEMARAYNVKPGDLLPSSTPRGPELDRIVAPLAMLPSGARSRFIVQMEAFARILAAEIAAAQAVGDASHAIGRSVSGYNSGSASARADEPGHVDGIVGGSPDGDMRDSGPAPQIPRNQAKRKI